MEDNLDKRYQILVILWFSLLMSIGLYFMVTVFALPTASPGLSGPARSFLIFALTALGTFLVIVSFAVKQKLLARSVERQDVTLVQKALIFSCAMCEVSALLGLLEHFLIGNREYYLLFLLATAGIIFHFPRRSQLEAASYKRPEQLT